MYRNLLLAIALMPIQIVPSQDPVSVKLSDGRIVPFGQGTICTDICTVDIPEPVSKKTTALLTVGTAITICAFLCRPNRHSNSVTTEVTISPIPEPNLLILLGLGLLIVVRKLKK